MILYGLASADEDCKILSSTNIIIVVLIFLGYFYCLLDMDIFLRNISENIELFSPVWYNHSKESTAEKSGSAQKTKQVHYGFRKIS